MAYINRPKRKRRQTYLNEAKRKERQKIYSTTRWRRLRLLKLNNSPLCEVCTSEGRITTATEVHHIISFTDFVEQSDRERYAFDYDNLQSICKQCHQKEHARTRHGKGRVLGAPAE